MSEEKYKSRDVQPTALRLHPDLRDKLVKIALRNGRSLSKEIAVRLQASFDQEKKSPDFIVHTSTGETQFLETKEPRAPYNVSVDTTDLDRAMLAVFRSLPPEKQLALLSLFK
jgi:hypothetical protein